MKDAYTKLMVQQHTSADADAVFLKSWKVPENNTRAFGKWRSQLPAFC